MKDQMWAALAASIHVGGVFPSLVLSAHLMCQISLINPFGSLALRGPSIFLQDTTA